MSNTINVPPTINIVDNNLTSFIIEGTKGSTGNVNLKTAGSSPGNIDIGPQYAIHLFKQPVESIHSNADRGQDDHALDKIAENFS